MQMLVAGFEAAGYGVDQMDKNRDGNCPGREAQKEYRPSRELGSTKQQNRERSP
ncbi:MAG: hypothetical protein J0J15_32755 [Mesorhizobium sp.]|nr:hypothetical protein [Mesorhizobium sp.]